MDESVQEKEYPIQNPDPAEQQKEGWNQPQPARLPRPTFWPAVLAFGIVLIPLGIITNLIISGVGLIIFALGLAGWIGELRNES